MEMNGAGTASALVCGLDEVTRERSRLEVDLDGALTEIEREEASSRRAIEDADTTARHQRDVIGEGNQPLGCALVLFVGSAAVRCAAAVPAAAVRPTLFTVAVMFIGHESSRGE